MDGGQGGVGDGRGKGGFNLEEMLSSIEQREGEVGGSSGGSKEEGLPGWFMKRVK